MCKCTACNREFEYEDKWSPMLNNSVWNQVLDYYGLRGEEIKREREFEKRWDVWEKCSGVQYGKLWDRLRDNDCHTYICYKCIEKALGRKITREDLIGANVPINAQFEKHYFND